MEIGILVHGRHVEADGWEKLVWGEPPDKLGSVPTMALEALNAVLGGIDVAAIVFGTGASEKEGLKESQYTKRFLMRNVHALGTFPLISNHPCFRSSSDWSRIEEKLAAIICETDSQNTIQEIENAAKIFAEREVNHVIQISCGSHLPRCIVCQRQVREAGKIPPEQRWYAVADDATFGGVPIQKSVVILEKPHRGDDPMILSPIQMHEVIPGLFGLPTMERAMALAELDARIKSIKSIVGGFKKPKDV